ncbi:hypothetical protein BDV40DRAFT_254173 [Aspergillus tamarii]|uniref:Uncharacterized protein n=1 Tax=Aspergillus tamarii TaxID=41984 RepID=A0A5N6V7S5_ASPTM|nr:hypothetical protein BDV40DRAFT_254173 [Aspergillus tamarii]
MAGPHHSRAYCSAMFCFPETSIYPRLCQLGVGSWICVSILYILLALFHCWPGKS